MEVNGGGVTRCDPQELFKRAEGLASSGDPARALAVCEQLVGGDLGGAELLWVARGMGLRCWCLRRLGRGEDLGLATQELQERFGTADPEYREVAHRGIFEWLYWLLGQGKISEADSVIDNLLDRLSKESHPAALQALADTALAAGTQFSVAGPVGQPMVVPAAMISGMARAIARPLRVAAEAVLERTPQRVQEGTVVRLWAGRQARLTRAAEIFGVLHGRFAAADNLALRAVATGALLNRPGALLAAGHFREARRDLAAIERLQTEELVNVIRRAERQPTIGYNPTDRAAALLVLQRVEHGQNVDGRAVAEARGLLS